MGALFIWHFGLQTPNSGGGDKPMGGFQGDDAWEGREPGVEVARTPDIFQLSPPGTCDQTDASIMHVRSSDRSERVHVHPLLAKIIFRGMTPAPHKGIRWVLALDFFICWSFLNPEFEIQSLFSFV